MLSSQIRGFLYGVLITTSLVSVITYASGTDGVFGDYFDNIIHDAVGCGANTAITGFDTAPANFGKQECTTFQNIVRTVLGVGTAPSGQAVVCFDVSGNPVYGDVNWHKDVSENISYTGAGNVGIGTNTPSAKLEVVGDIAVSGKVCSGTAPNSVCLDKQKGDPMYLTGVVHYTGTMPTNNATTGILGQGIKAEWDNYGRAGCQAYATLYGTWTPTDVINCQSAYPGDGNSLTATINRTRSEAELLNMTWYQIMGGNPWIPHDCVSLNIVYICDGATNCGAHPSWTDYMTPDFLQYTCISK